MKKIISITISIIISMLIAVIPVSAELKTGYREYGDTKYSYKYEDIGDFRYIYNNDGVLLQVLFNKRSSEKEIDRIEFPVEYKFFSNNIKK